MSNFLRHPYHLVDESPWPLLRAIRALFLTSGLLNWFNSNSLFLLSLSLLSLFLCSFQWWRDVRAEGAYQGLHTGIVELGLRWGIILFIISEIFFFLSFFWAYFHRRLAPSLEVGRLWPPTGVNCLNPIEMPLVNTIVLITSGIRVTWAHHRIIIKNHKETSLGLFLTILLGGIFTALQGIEYFETSFRFADSVYGSVFFIATGFHGLHVLVGSLFLLFCYVRLNKGQFRDKHHFGFEASAWYWHFVDVVWLFLYLVIYWWGSL